VSKGLQPEPGGPPPKVVFEGVKEGSREEAELFNTYQGEISRFHFKARQAAQLSGLPQFRMHNAIDGMAGSASYIRNNGQETLRVKLDDEIVVTAPKPEPKPVETSIEQPRWLAIDIITTHHEFVSRRQTNTDPPPTSVSELFVPDFDYAGRLSETDKPEHGANTTLVLVGDDQLDPGFYSASRKAIEGVKESPSKREYNWVGYDAVFPNSIVNGFVVKAPYGTGELSLDLRLATANATRIAVNSEYIALEYKPDITWCVQVREFVGAEPSIGVVRMDYEGLTRTVYSGTTEEVVNLHVENFAAGVMAVGKDWVDLSAPEVLSAADEDTGYLLDRTEVGTTPVVATIPLDLETGGIDTNYDMRDATFVARITYHRPSGKGVRHGRAKIERVA